MSALTTVQMLLEEYRLHFGADPSRDKHEGATPISHRVLAANETRIGLALSGGGIRSATFALGVLQALSELRLLTSIDYLSTVSGGGYIGSWLSAWAHRHPRGIDGVMQELGERTGESDHEAAPVRHLRSYSNYLTPRKGLLSTDTWTIVGTYIRNLLVNWLTLVPYFLLALLLPLIGVEVLRVATGELFRTPFVFGLAPADLLLIAGLLLLVSAIGVLGSSLPTCSPQDHKDKLVITNQVQFLRDALVPLMAGVLALAACWASYVTAPAGNTLLLSPLTGFLPQWVVFALLGVVAHLAASAWYIARMWRYELKGGRRLLGRTDAFGWIEPLAVVISGAVGGWIIWVLATKVVPAPVSNPAALLEPLEVYLVASVPSFLLGFLFALTLYIALGSRLMWDEDREWLARAGAWILIVAAGWIAIGAITLLGPDILQWLWTYARKWAISIGGLSGIVSMWLGRSNYTKARDERGGQNRAALAADWGLKLAAPVFVIVLAILGASALRALKNLLMTALSLPSWGAVAAIAVALIVVILVVAFAVNVNVFSLHGMYRDRLIRAYLGASRTERKPNRFTGFDPDDNMAMAHLARPFFSTRDWPLIHTIASVLEQSHGDRKSAVHAAIVAVDPQLLAKTLAISEWCDADVHSVVHRFNYVLSSSKRAPQLAREWEDAVKARYPHPQFGPHEWATVAAIAGELHARRDNDSRTPEAAKHRVVLQTLVRERDRSWIDDTAAVPFWRRDEVLRLTDRLNAVVGLPSDAVAAAVAAPASNPRYAAPVSLRGSLRDVIEQPANETFPGDPQTLRRGLEELVPKRRTAPLHIVNTAVNIVAGQELAWQERKAASFTFTPFHAGSSLVNYRPMAGNASQPQAYGGTSGMTLGTAIAISGAAANPNMGYHSSPVVTLLLTLFNARLGAWVGNPNDDRCFGHSYPRHRLLPMALVEAFGFVHATGSYVNLSDGGHFDNLGLYELVRRGCGHVIVSDAGCDGSYAFEDLGNAVRKIRVDFGIDITFTGFRVGRQRQSTDEKIQGQYVALGKIHYGRRSPGVEDGNLLYVKPAIFEKDEPIDVVQYGRANPSYPHESTSDQWFSESQFESYRALGRYILMAVSGQKENAPPPRNVAALFEQVKATLAN